MLKKSKVKSATRISEDRRRNGAKSSNLHVSPSFPNKPERSSTRKQRTQFSKSSSGPQEKSASNATSKSPPTPAVPKDAAVHFGNFYGIRENAGGKVSAGNAKSFASDETASFRVTPRSEFTRQMVTKLERTAGTEEYARQVSALLEETVEPPCFKLNSLPAEDSIPDGKHNPSGYPLWYKEPYKMPFTSNEILKLLKEKYGDESRRADDIFDEEFSEVDAEEELSEEERVQEEQSPNEHLDIKNSARKAESSTDRFSSRSTSVTETKDSDSRESEVDNNCA